MDTGELQITVSASQDELRRLSSLTGELCLNIKGMQVGYKTGVNNISLEDKYLLEKLHNQLEHHLRVTDGLQDEGHADGIHTYRFLEELPTGDKQDITGLHFQDHSQAVEYAQTMCGLLPVESKISVYYTDGQLVNGQGRLVGKVEHTVRRIF